MNIELDYIQSLIKMASESDLTELKVSSGDDQIVIKKEKETHFAQAPAQIASAPIALQTPVATESVSTDAPIAEVKEETKKGNAVNSPIVGTYYSAPSPDSPPFVKIGSKVNVGDVLCIIESMKLMNEIESEVAGTVTEICIENSEAVDAGTVLMYIE